MPNKLDLLLVNGVTLGLILLILFGGCGTLTGNPENGVNATAAAPVKGDFLSPIGDYIASASSVADCGYFTQQSTQADIDAGRQCVRDHFAACTSAKYLFDDTKTDGKRFVAFVGVEVTSDSPLARQIKIHAVSDDASRFVGDQTKSCETIGDPLELSCGIGS
jgi:hypothetical protein